MLSGIEVGASLVPCPPLPLLWTISPCSCCVSISSGFSSSGYSENISDSKDYIPDCPVGSCVLVGSERELDKNSGHSCSGGSSAPGG